jgi:thiamine-monophosphate kinase
MTNRLSEDEIIARIFAPLAGLGSLDLRDDAALLSPPPGHQLVATTDALVAGVHFFPNDPAPLIARKALRVNVSDLAAKAADPWAYLLSLALPQEGDVDWLKAFAQGLKEDGHAFGLSLIGGDTVRTPGPLMINVTALGLVPQGAMIQRTTAKAGDRIYVSGTIGDSALGLALRQKTFARSDEVKSEWQDYLLNRYLLPQPRTGLIMSLRNHAQASMDVSDGLIGDLTKLTKVSHVSARVELSRIPLSPAARDVIALQEDAFDRAVTGGDDYEILCTVPPVASADFERAAAKAHILVTYIGDVIPGDQPPLWLDKTGQTKTFGKASFSHF